MKQILCSLTAVWLMSAAAFGLINIKFTPIQLASEAKEIIALELTAPAGGKMAGNGPVALKGKLDGKMEFDLSEAGDIATEAIEKGFGGGKTGQAILFTGDFSAASEGGVDASNRPAAVLQIGTEWVALTRKGDAWSVVEDPLDMSAVWGGSSSMLAEAVKYALADPRAEMPSAIDAPWGRETEVGKLTGRVNGLLPVTLSENIPPAVLILAESGDRLLAREAGKLVGKPMPTKSQHAAWGDFTGDGRLDLASWDGSKLTLATAGENDSFTATEMKADVQECRGLSALDVGKGARAGLLVSTSAQPVLLVSESDGAFTSRKIGGDKTPGAGGPCVVADVTGDGITDILQPFRQGMLLHAGEKPGIFQSPVTTDWKDLGDAVAAVAGDYDADGRLDLLVVHPQGGRLLRNLGGGKFAEIMAETGELAYHGAPGYIATANGDINNDGRQDMLLVYPKLAPHLFFNRGFATFGYARELDLGQSELKAAQTLREGVQAAVLADLDGDGAQDLVAVDLQGSIWVLSREGGALGVLVSLPPGEAGPLTITGKGESRSYGARVLAAGGTDAFFGATEPGPVAIGWKTPDGKTHQGEAIAEDGLSRFALPGGS